MSKIKTIKQNLITESGKETVKIESFDENGNILSRVYYEDGEITGKEIRKYNENNQVISYDEFDNDTDINMSYLFEYDEKGRLLTEEEIFVHAGSYKSIKKHEYNSDSKIINIADDDGEFEGKIITKFNENSQVTEEEVFNEFNKIDKHIKNEYSEHGLSKTINFATKTSNYNEHYYFYGENGEVAEEKITNKKGKLLQQIMRAYDDEKRQTSVKLGDLQNKKTAEYSIEYTHEKTEVSIFENHNLAKKEITFFDNNKNEIKYIEQSNFIEGKAQTIIEHEYEYENF